MIFELPPPSWDQLQGSLHPQIVLRHVPTDGLRGAERGANNTALLHLIGTGSYQTPQARAEWSGQVSGQVTDQTSDRGKSENKSKTTGGNYSASFLLRESFFELTFFDELYFKGGKATFDFSNAFLTSPSNPALAGLPLPSPLTPQEGIWQTSLKWIPNLNWSYELGSSYELFAPGGISPFPFAKVTRHLDSSDQWLLGSDRFLGIGANWQAGSTLLTYLEANFHASRYALDQVRADGLLGQRWSPEAIPIQFTLEYFRSGEGTGSRKPSHAGERSTAYSFPAPSGLAKPIWGTSAFLGSHYALLDLRKSASDWGPYLTYVQSLSDLSFVSMIGLSFNHALSFQKDAGRFQIEWKHFHGQALTDFGEAKRSLGENQLWIGVTF